MAGSPQPVDWANFFDGNGDELPLPTGFDASSFDRDFVTNANGIFNTSDTTFTTGSKDTLAIDPGWQYTASNNVNSILDRHDRTILETIAVGAEILASGADVITLGRGRSTRPVPTGRRRSARSGGGRRPAAAQPAHG